jgi:N-ethylmaleimide reductase
MSKLFSPIRIGAIDAVTSVWGRDRVGARIGPRSKFGAVGDSTPDVTFPDVARALTHFGVAYLHVIEPRVVANTSDADKPTAGLPRSLFRGPMIAAGSAFTEPVADRICVVVDVLGTESV